MSAEVPTAGETGAAGRCVALIGFMGAGKSTSAKELARAMTWPLRDGDSAFEERAGMTIDRFFETKGERAFRALEAELATDLLEPGAVVALGGGAVTSEEVRARLRECVCVYLEVDPQLAWRRVTRSARPLARDRELFFKLHNERKSLYEELATVFVSGRTRGTVARLRPLIEDLASGDLPASLKLLWAECQRPYPVFFVPGILGSIGDLWRWQKSFLISDASVFDRFGSQIETALGERLVGHHLLVPGEEQKTLASAEQALRAMAEAKVSRDDCVLAVGGGVVGDVAGFCAAVYQRGIDVVHVPTTVVGQVDSAYGGKTGVDLPAAKNYVGAFHQPTAVIVDPETLKTLPDQETAAGYAEVVKTALISGGKLWSDLLGDAQLDDLILGCIRTKLDVVARDEFDRGGRAALNLGHTIAHALEAATGYRRYRHGEAVAIGLLAALELSERQVGLAPDIRAKVSRIFADRGLPTALGEVDMAQVLDRLTYDKKTSGGSINWVLLAEPGKVLTEQRQVEKTEVASVLASLGSGGGS